LRVGYRGWAGDEVRTVVGGVAGGEQEGKGGAMRAADFGGREGDTVQWEVWCI